MSRSLLPVPIQQRIEAFFAKKVTAAQQVHGGSINEALSIQLGKDIFFLKYNTASKAHAMLQAECMGLDHLAATNCIKTPEIILLDQVDRYSFLVLEFIDTIASTTKFELTFAQQLAALHQQTNTYFGLDHSNYIGLLEQQNNQHSNWISFYTQERLSPQFESALAQRYFDRNATQLFERFCQNLNELIPAEQPSLIHGDLWSGNFLCNLHEEPILIDPAIAYAHREMDIAMSLLFGGLSDRFYHAYHEAFPMAPGWENRMAIFQLYYLLVHVNLFGHSYVPEVLRILQKYA
ncbi:MAG: fructosamine kinase family protein [Bacteroidota bacterium]